ncbi:hypothetical protein [Streptomyces hygroscopicus]|uniref:hypothetical protein n=1 Tax=Streptomyces hygroscopicus TaxID=1912 RepID=UPI0007674FBD|nr:hypothetical protein [Streptomyces hygroscopicus]
MSTRAKPTLGGIIAAALRAELPGLGTESSRIGDRAEEDLRAAGWRIQHQARPAPAPPAAVTAVLSARLRGDVPGLTDTEARTTAQHALVIARVQGWQIASTRPTPSRRR